MSAQTPAQTPFSPVVLCRHCGRRINVSERLRLCDECRGDIDYGSIPDVTSWSCRTPELCPYESMLVNVYNPAAENLYIHGPHGTGKTWCVGMAVSLYELRGYSTTFADPDQYSRIELHFGLSLAYESVTKDVLVFDDIDKLFLFEWQLSRLFMTLDARERWRCKGVIVTSNMTPQELLDCFVSRCKTNETLATGIMERLNPCRKVELNGHSNRPRLKT